MTSKIPAAAVEAVAAARYGHVAPVYLLGRREDIRRELEAALPHLVGDKVVERAALALWAEGHRTPSPPHPDMAYWRQIARRAFEAVPGAPVKAGAVDEDES